MYVRVIFGKVIINLSFCTDYLGSLGFAADYTTRITTLFVIVRFKALNVMFKGNEPVSVGVPSIEPSLVALKNFGICEKMKRGRSRPTTLN